MTKDFEVLCRGIPWECTDNQLRDFFGDSGIESVDIPRRNGRAQGDATVTFTNEDDYKNALKKDREHMGTRYIEVFTADSAPRKRIDRDRDDFRRSGPPRDRYSDRRSGGMGGSSNGEAIVRLRGLPFSVTMRDITDFLAPLPIVRDGVLLPDQQRGRPSGEAYVCFENMESVQIAKQRHMKNIGHRYIEVFEASFREMSRFADDNGLRVPRFGPQPFVSGPPAGGPPRGAYDPYADRDGYRRDSGPRREPDDPYARPRQDMYQSYGSTYDPYPQPSAYGGGGAQAVGYYDSLAPKAGGFDGYGRDRLDQRDPRAPLDPRDARDPRDFDQRDRPSDGRRAAPVDPYTGEPRYSEYGGGSGFDSRDSRDPYWRGGNSGPPAGAGGPPVPAARDPYSAGDSWASGGGAPPSDRDRYVGYPSEPYAQREGGGAMRRPEYGRSDDRYAKPDPYGYGRGPDYGARSAAPPAAQNQQFILRMRGIPFRATENDVYEFFHPSRPNNVELLRDAYQRLSGDARVIFYNRKDYDDALMKDKHYLGERYIEIIPDNGRY
uniref:RRM domain-containing protein n=1 Tax=Caenorhabditis japonica TaxID=281687 RepID=A0A8R1I8R9_CAEJA